ncbi:MAG: FBP domain-containing protein [Nakamurella sp.]
MKPATQQEIRASLANCSRGEAARMTFPAGYRDLSWADIEYLGWRDPKAPLRGYLVIWRADRLVGIALRAPEAVTKKSVMCTLCRSTHSSGGVALFVAKLAGAAGRADNTVGTYICADLNCSRYARQPKPTVSVRPEPGKSLEEKLAGLQERAAAFVDRVLQ